MMLDDSPHTVASWLDQHFGSVVTFVTVVVGLIVNYVLQGASIRQHGKDLEKLDVRLGDVEDCVEKHNADTGRHIDPVRDERRWQEMKEYLLRIESKVDQRNESRRSRQ